VRPAAAHRVDAPRGVRRVALCAEWDLPLGGHAVLALLLLLLLLLVVVVVVVSMLLLLLILLLLLLLLLLLILLLLLLILLLLILLLLLVLQELLLLRWHHRHRRTRRLRERAERLHAAREPRARAHCKPGGRAGAGGTEARCAPKDCAKRICGRVCPISTG